MNKSDSYKKLKRVFHVDAKEALFYRTTLNSDTRLSLRNLKHGQLVTIRVQQDSIGGHNFVKLPEKSYICALLSPPLKTIALPLTNKPNAIDIITIAKNKSGYYFTLTTDFH